MFVSDGTCSLVVRSDAYYREIHDKPISCRMMKCVDHTDFPFLVVLLCFPVNIASEIYGDYYYNQHCTYALPLLPSRPGPVSSSRMCSDRRGMIL